MTTAAARKRKRQKKKATTFGPQSGGVLHGQKPKKKPVPIGPQSGGVLHGQPPPKQYHPKPTKKPAPKPPAPGGSGSGGTPAPPRTPPPPLPTSDNSYTPNPADNELGNGVMSQQGAAGAGQMDWPGAGGGGPLPQPVTQQPAAAGPPTLGSPATWHPQPGMTGLVAPTRENVGTGLQSFGSWYPAAATTAPLPGAAPTGVFHPAIATGPSGTQQPAGGGNHSGGSTSTGDHVGNPAPTSAPTTPATPADAQKQQDQQNAQMLLQSMLDSWGIGSLGSVVLGYLQQGYDATAIQYLLTQTPEYKRRFAANDARIKAGLGALSPAEYLATERAYQDVLRSAGLPAGFYDSPDDFTSWLSKDVSPAEVSSRADEAVKFAMSTDPTYRQALSTYYGIDTSHIAAYFLDPARAMPLLKKQGDAASIGAAALRQGLQATNLNDAFQYVDQGVTEQQAQQAYGSIADILPTETAIGNRFGDAYSQTDAEQELLGGLASASRKRQRLNQQEEALFSGKSGSSSSAGLGVSTAGAF